ncbi:hypothetical protein M3Y94_00705700 [Aphelenchoides besseyi]|nr:hypothetical protein M3Y94_00705700 [Aphelenchoides besseyi]
MSRGIRKFGLTYTTKWIIFVASCYFGFLTLWHLDSVEERVELMDENRATIQIPRPRRIDVPILLNGSNDLNAIYVDEPEKHVIAVLVFCATRDGAIRNHLQQLINRRPDPNSFPIYVSQDGETSAVRSTIEEFQETAQNIHYLQHKHDSPQTQQQRVAKNYFHIAKHYKWALDRLFANHSTVLITEDDLDISADFFSFFTNTRQILDLDPTVWCISAWNDNGASTVTDQSRTELLYRTDFFPGLGWMLKAETWAELTGKWPDFYWDDWMRQPEVRRNRVCIRPEVSRTAHNMKLAGKGSSGGLYKSFLASIHLPNQPVDFSLVDMSRLRKSAYDQTLRQQLLDAKPISISELLNNQFESENTKFDSQFAYRVSYGDPREFRRIARKFKLMEDVRSGMSRTAYLGVVTFLAPSHVRIYAVHSNFNLTAEEQNSDEIYDTKWDLMTRFLDFSALYCRPEKWTGKCDPKSPEMIAWFDGRHQRKRLNAWGEMIVF